MFVCLLSRLFVRLCACACVFAFVSLFARSLGVVGSGVPWRLAGTWPVVACTQVYGAGRRAGKRAQSPAAAVANFTM